MNYIRFYYIICVLVIFLISEGCTDRDTRAAPGLKSRAVTLVSSCGGIGDNGYNDLILSAIMGYYTRHESEVSLSMRHPTGMEEARDILNEWLKQTSTEDVDSPRSLLLLASSSYKELLEDGELNLKAHQRIFIFECGHNGLPIGVSSFRITRYGASFLAGLMASDCPEADIISAVNDDIPIKEAEDGFRDGFRAGNKEGNIRTHYLSDNVDGYTLPQEAYNVARNLEETFIFPVAGGSNSGIYRYSRENPLTLQLICGMDTDCSDYSTRIPFSMVIHIDNILRDLLEHWHTSGSIPDHSDYYMTDGAEIIVNPFFFERAMIYRDYYLDPDYWKLRKEKYYETAKEMEKRYYEI